MRKMQMNLSQEQIPKYLIFDFDGTVFVNGSVDPRTLSAMQKAQRFGCKLILNTGRSRGFFEGLFDQICPIEWDIKLFGMSDVVVGDKTLQQNNLTKQEIMPWFRYCRKHRMHLYIEGVTGRSCFAFDKDPKADTLWHRWKDYYKLKQCIKQNPPTKLNVHGMADFSDLPRKSIMQVLQHTGYFEITPPGRDKGTITMDFCHLIGADISECCCFGDSINDLAIFQVCPIRICMKSAPPELKELSDYCAESESSGVAEGIYWIFKKAGISFK